MTERSAFLIVRSAEGERTIPALPDEEAKAQRDALLRALGIRRRSAGEGI